MPIKSAKPPKIKKNIKSRQRQAYSVFLSYSSKDRFIAETIIDKLEAIGVQTWADTKSMEGGGITIREIIAAIDACNEVIVLVSPNSIESQWVLFEIGVARGKDKRTTPVLCNIDPNDMAPMKDVVAIDLNKFDQFLIQLQERIKQH
jgi:isopentenyl diphosphate isomerase/L-lactate dehydrogenase-like FMN-dependent dehydrogenase